MNKDRGQNTQVYSRKATHLFGDGHKSHLMPMGSHHSSKRGPRGWSRHARRPKTRPPGPPLYGMPEIAASAHMRTGVSILWMLTSEVFAPQQSRSFSSRLPIVCFVSHMLHENEEKKGWCGNASARQASRSVSVLGRREDAHLHPRPSISAERTCYRQRGTTVE